MQTLVGACASIPFVAPAPADSVLPLFSGVAEDTRSAVTTIGPSVPEMRRNNVCFPGTGDSCAHLASRGKVFGASAQGNLTHFFFSTSSEQSRVGWSFRVVLEPDKLPNS